MLDKIVGEYNRYHGTEAQVRVLEQKQHGGGIYTLLARFTGPYCLSCAPEEYHTDFQILLKEKTGLKITVRSIEMKDEGAVVEYEYAKPT